MINQRQHIIVIQSRLSSTRLPAKAVLPLANYPIVVLCALRATNTGIPVIVATSEDNSDEIIAQVIRGHGIRCFRGSLNDVLDRVTQSVAAYSDHDLIVRLTADNVVPDGVFIEFLLQSFNEQQFDYLGTSSPQDGLPYGLSAEIFKIGVLREANNKAETSFDREHVTPYIKRHFRCQQFIFKNAPSNWNNLRCTLDTYEDYNQLLHLFYGVNNPLAISWQELVERMDVLEQTRDKFNEGEVSRREHYTKLTLGTAQLGLTYGIANSNGLPNSTNASNILHKAVRAGIYCFDTARAYGFSEERVGEALAGSEGIRIISKLHPFDYLPADASSNQVRDAVKASVYETCYYLKLKTLDALLLHRWEHRYKWDGMVWNELLVMKQKGLIKKIGVSVVNPDEAMDASNEPEIELIQCPVNILDWRWRQNDFLNAIKKRKNLIFFARSIYLQGLLLMDKNYWPMFPEVNGEELNKTIDDLVTQFNRKNRKDLCLAYVRGLPWVSSLVIGMETEQQLEENLNLFHEPFLTLEQINKVHQAIEYLPEEFLNPAQWNLK